MSRNFPFQHFLKPSMEQNAPREEEQLEFDKLNDMSTELGFSSNPPPTPESNEELGKEMRNVIEKITSPDKFNAFFKNLEIQNLTDSEITFFVPTSFIKTMITEYLISFLEEAILKTLGSNRKICIETKLSKKTSYSIDNTVPPSPSSVKKPSVVRFLNNSLETEESLIRKRPPELPEKNDSIEQKSEQKGINLDLIPTKEDLLSKVESKYINHMQPDQSGILIDPNKTFENFIIGPSNNIACATAKAVANNPGKSGKYPSLYFYSDSGLGKTHLLHSVANTINRHHPSLIVCLITARDFMNEMIHSIQNNNISRFRKKYSEKIDVLMIDDIHELKDKGFSYLRDLVLSTQPMISLLKPNEGFGIYLDSEEPYFRWKIETNWNGNMRTLLAPEDFNIIPSKVNGVCRLVKIPPNNQKPYTSLIELKQNKFNEIINGLYLCISDTFIFDPYLIHTI